MKCLYKIILIPLWKLFNLLIFPLKYTLIIAKNIIKTIFNILDDVVMALCLDEYDYQLRKKQKKEKEIMKKRGENFEKNKTFKMEANRIAIAYEDHSHSAYRLKKNDIENQIKKHHFDKQLENQMDGLKELFETNPTLKKKEQIQNHNKNVQNFEFQQHLHRIKDEKSIENQSGIDVPDFKIIQIRENDEIACKNQMKENSSGNIEGSNYSDGQIEESKDSEIKSEKNFEQERNKKPRETLKNQLGKYKE